MPATFGIDGDAGRGKRFDVAQDGARGDLELFGQGIRGQLAALTQQHGFIHAGMMATVLDSACGYAGLSVMPLEAGVLSIEFKINLLAPAKGQSFRCEGVVLKPGRTIVVTEGRAYAIDGGQEKLVATMNCTLMALENRPGIAAV